MAKQEDYYDKKKQTMWLFRDYEVAETLVPNEELMQWSKAARDGKTRDGEPLKVVNYVFPNEATAEYNHSALAFASVGTYVGSVKKPIAYDEDAPTFSTRDDFGIK